jgi:hypothetical protein
MGICGFAGKDVDDACGSKDKCLTTLVCESSTSRRRFCLLLKSSALLVCLWQSGLALLSKALLPLRLYPSPRVSWISLLGLGRLATHDNSTGSLCHATQASAWGYPSRVPCLTGLVCACGDGYLGILSSLARRPLGKCSILSSITASWRMVFEGLPSCGPNTNLSLFPPCYMLQWWPFANEHKEKAQAFPENGIKGRINILEVKAYSSGSQMNVSDHVYIIHCSRYIRSKQETPKAA